MICRGGTKLPPAGPPWDEPQAMGAPPLQHRLDQLHRALVTLAGFADVAVAALQPLAHQGVAHDHIRIGGLKALMRVPRLSQFRLEPRANLAYQAQCFARAEASQRTPHLIAIIQPGRGVEHGALIVEEIEGSPPLLPSDLQALAETFAVVHGLALPPPALRPPLADHPDAVAGTLGFIEAQAPYLERAVTNRAARRQIEAELAWAREFADTVRGREQPQALVLTDAHPGNFLVDRRGRAIFVDLEKAVYGSPAADLAHASLYTSTLWDRRVAAVLTRDEVGDFYRRYLSHIGRRPAAALAPWLMPFRRLIWLRTTSWCARWAVLSAEPGSDWSAAALPADLIAYTRSRIADAFRHGHPHRFAPG